MFLFIPKRLKEGIIEKIISQQMSTEKLTIVDKNEFNVSTINRQVRSSFTTVGNSKTKNKTEEILIILK